jgi:outer membrane autotransporter protein
MSGNAHAATVQNFSITNYQSANGFCFVSFSADVTGTRNDVVNGVASTNDLIKVQAHDSRGSAIQGNNTTSGNFFTSTVPNGQTNTVTGTVNFAGSDVNGGPLTLIMDEGGLPFEVVGSLPLDLTTMSALGGGCATAATAAGFGNQPPVISFNQSSPFDGTGFTFNGSQENIRAEARFSNDPENDPLTYSWRQIKGQNLINNGTVLNDERLQVRYPSLLFARPEELEFELALSDGSATTRDIYNLTVVPQNAVERLTVTGVANSDRIQSSGSNCVISTAIDVIGFQSETQFNRDEYAINYTTDGGFNNGSTSNFVGVGILDNNFTTNLSLPASGGSFNNLNNFNNITMTVSDTGTNSSGNIVYSKTIPITDFPTTGACGTILSQKNAGSSNNIPVANAGPDQILTVSPGDSITLDASSSSDPDGDSITYRWTQVSGPTVTLSGANSLSPSFSRVPAPGQTEVLTFNLIVNDGQADSSVDLVEVRLTRANAAPIANAGPDQQIRNVTTSTVVTLNGSASSDPDNDPLSYQWTQVSGSAVSLSGATTPNPTFTGFTPSGSETLVFELVVNDGTIASIVDRVEVLLSSTNSLPPTAVATGPTNPVVLSGQPGQTIQLVGSNSSDPDNDPLTFQWTQVSGTETLVFAGGTSATDADIELNAPSVAGNYVFELSVDDGTNAPVITTVSFSFSPPNSAPVADAGANQAVTVAASTVITLDGSGSSDPDGDTITYQWTQTSGTPVTLSDATAVQPTFSYLPSAVETLTFELVVSDGTLTSVADSVSIEITPGVTAGTVNQVTALERINSCDANINFDFTGFTDDNAGFDQYRLAITSGTSNATVGGARDEQARVSFTESAVRGVALLQNGTTTAPTQPLFASLLDIDNNGVVVSRLSQASIDLDSFAAAGPNCRATVKSIRGNQIPVANAGPDQIINNVDANTTVTLDASASTDADSDALTYRWVQTSGPTVTLTNPTTATPSFTFVPAIMDTIIFDVFVSDGEDESQADSVEIKLNRANVLPVANAGQNLTLRTARPGATQTPQPLTLDGTLSSDADGDALTYRWAQVTGPTLSLASGSSLTDAQPVFDAPNQEGTFNFELVVNDGFGDSAADQVEVVYTFFDNEAPVADAGPNQTIDQAVGNVSVSLSASATDAENDALTFAWTQVSGPAVTLSDVTAIAPSFTFDMTGQTSDVVFVFSVTANDGQLTSTADEVTVTLTPNAIPVADAGANQTIARLTADTIVSLDGTASTDGDGDRLSYAWTQVSGPAVTLSDASSAAPTFSYDPGSDTSSQTFVFDLVVNDGIVDSAADRVEIVASPNNVPTADAGPAQVEAAYVAGSPVQLDGRSSSDPNGDQLQYEWVQLSGPSVSLDDPTSATPSFTFDPSGNSSGLVATQAKSGASNTVSQMPNPAVIFVFGLVVSDGDLRSVQSQVQVSLTVNDPPEANAGEDQTLETPADGATITLDGSGSSDPEGDPLTYSWVQTSGRTISLSDATVVNPTFNYDYPNPLPAEESFTFALTINDGNQNSVADEVTITIINNQAPTANAGADIGPINSGDIVTLNGGASTDPDGDVLTYAWTQVSGTMVTLSDATTQNPTFTAPDVEDLSTLVFELVVNDGRVDSPADQVSVSVQPVGSVRLVQRVTGSDGTFSYTSDLAALNASLTTSGGTGELIAERVGTGQYIITARDERDNGYALTGLTCSDDDSTTDLSARTANIRLAPGEDVTCTFDLVNSREAASDAIRTALVARSQLILASEPDLQRRIDRLNKQVRSGSGASIAGLTLPGSNKVGLSASLSETSKSVSGSLLAANADGVLKGQLDGATKSGKIDVWGEAQIQDFNFQGEDGDFSILHMGADYLVSDNLLVGALVSIDDFRYGDVDQAGYVSGDGFLAGPYATAKLGENLYIDGRAAWGSSDNTVNPLGNFSDDFDTNRAFYAGTITGDWTFKNKLSVRPELSVKHLSESQNSYTDALGVVIPEQTIGLGELAFGPRLSKPITLGRKWIMTPYGEAKGIYNFGSDAKDILQNDTRLRLEGGADWSSINGVRIGLSGFTDGIGSDDLESYGIRVSLAYTMK